MNDYVSCLSSTAYSMSAAMLLLPLKESFFAFRTVQTCVPCTWHSSRVGATAHPELAVGGVTMLAGEPALTGVDVGRLSVLTLNGRRALLMM